MPINIGCKRFSETIFPSLKIIPAFVGTIPAFVSVIPAVVSAILAGVAIIRAVVGTIPTVVAIIPAVVAIIRARCNVSYSPGNPVSRGVFLLGAPRVKAWSAKKYAFPPPFQMRIARPINLID